MKVLVFIVAPAVVLGGEGSGKRAPGSKAPRKKALGKKTPVWNGRLRLERKERIEWRDSYNQFDLAYWQTEKTEELGTVGEEIQKKFWANKLADWKPYLDYIAAYMVSANAL